MSYGAISRPAVQALGAGAKRAGCWLNTGESGLAPEHLESGADLVVQIGTANYGVRDADGALDWNALRTAAARPQVRTIELKLSQGAKPGKGGLLPGAKVTPQIATIRGIPVGRDSVSPNRRRDVADVNQLLDLLALLREATGKPVGVKLVLGAYGWLDELCGAITRRGTVEFAPDFITLDGAEGGSGAAPQSLMDYAGLPLRESLPMLVNTLHRHGLGERVRVIASGKLVTPDEVAWALCAGADFVTSARGFMFALGCSRPCAATATPARPVSPPTTRACNRAWIRPTRACGWRSTSPACSVKSASSPIPAACLNHTACAAITPAPCSQTAVPAHWTSFKARTRAASPSRLVAPRCRSPHETVREAPDGPFRRFPPRAWHV